MKEVGCPGEEQEEDPRPSRRHLLPEGQGAEGVGNHQRLPCEEGGATDEACASPVRDGIRGVIRRDDAFQGSALPLQSHTTHQGGDGAFLG